MQAIRRTLSRVPIGSIIGLLLLVELVALRLWDPPLLEALRLKTFDLLQTIRPRDSDQRPVVIVDLDERSLKELGQWPWPRTLLADMVDKVTAMGAVAIAFDMVFPEPDRVSPGVAAEAFRGLDEETKAKLRQLPSNDAVLAEAIGRSKVVLGQSGYTITGREGPAGERVQTGLAMLGRDPTPFLMDFPFLLPNVAVLEEAAAGRGLFSIKPERDGVIRRVPLIALADGVVVPALSLELLKVAIGGQAVAIDTGELGVRSVVINSERGAYKIPTDGQGRLWVHFGPHDSKRFVSAVDVIRGEGRANSGLFQGRVVLVGTSAIGLQDIKNTPVDAGMPGVEVHAQVIENVLGQSVLTLPAESTLVEITIAVLLGLAMIAFSPHLGAWALFLLGGFVAATVVGLSWWYFVEKRILFDLTFPLLSSFLVYAMVVFTNYIRSQAERRRIRSAFKQYLSPALVEQLAKSPERLVLGGERREMTVMFSDVRGFTTISELYKDDPQGLISLMNRFLTPLTNAIIEQQGTIDKYMGDNIMSFWNAPLDVPGHELKACEAALVMMQRLEELNAVRKKEADAAGTPFIPLACGIGINTGPCVVGNMGSELRFDYSVLGDTVNLASRLESQSKNYGVTLVVGPGTAAAVRERYAVIELDLLQVKGKNEPQHVFTVLGRENIRASERFRRLATAHEALLARYRAGEWSQALEALLSCREAGRSFGLDYLYERYLERIRTLMEAPPEAGWNGVYVAETK